MQLSGSFEAQDFVEIADLLARRRCSGRLAIRAGGLRGAVRLVDGDVVSAEASGSALINARSTWQVTLEYILFEVLQADYGTFDYQPDEGALVAPGPRVTFKESFDGARLRLETWRKVEKVIHSFEAVPRLADTLPAEITVGRESWSVLVALDGRRTVAGLAKRLNRDILEFCEVLEPLVREGAVAVDQSEAPSRSLPKVRLQCNLGEALPVVDDDEGLVSVIRGGLPLGIVRPRTPIAELASVEPQVEIFPPLEVTAGDGVSSDQSDESDDAHRVTRRRGFRGRGPLLRGASGE